MRRSIGFITDRVRIYEIIETIQSLSSYITQEANSKNVDDAERRNLVKLDNIIPNLQRLPDRGYNHNQC